jgi:hypothetical protein
VSFEKRAAALRYDLDLPTVQRNCLGDLGQYELTELSHSCDFGLVANIRVTE